MPTDPSMPLTEQDLEVITKRVEYVASAALADSKVTRDLLADALVLAAEVRRLRQIIRNRNDWG